MVIQDGGPICGCGEPGHAEALASRLAIERYIQDAIAQGQTSLVTNLMADRGRAMITSSVLADAFKAGDKVLLDAVAIAQRHLGHLIASCVNLIDPEVIIIGGGVIEKLGETYLGPVRKVAEQHYINKIGIETVRIVPAELGDYAGVVGAAVLANIRL